ncbi:MAG: DUF3999 family protein [Sphingomonadaceae bacterium]
MIRKAMIAALALLAGCAGEAPKDAARHDGYALRLEVTPAEGGNLQRVTLPPAALVSLMRADAGDVRIFDSGGAVISLARQPVDAVEEFSANKVAVYPIEGPAAAPGASAISLRIDSDADIAISARRAEAQAVSGPAALLFDTRRLTDPLAAIQLDAELPPGRPVEVTLEASADLKSWDALGSKVLFRGEAGQELLGSARIALGGPVLKDRYLRASWPAAPGVLIRGGTIFTARTAPPAAVAIAADGAVLAADHDLRFALPAGYPPRAIRVTGPESIGVVPVRVYGREAPERPWVALAAGTLRDGKPAQIDLTGAGFAEYKLEADQRSAGFGAVPKIELLYDPVVLIAAFNGKPPYNLAIGNAAAPSAFFAPGDLLGDLPIWATLPKAKIGNPPANPVVKLAPTGNDGPFTPRKLALWAALLAAVAVLAFAAVRLIKAPVSQPTD